MSAKEMLEELGYVIRYENSTISYYKFECRNYVRFWKHLGQVKIENPIDVDELKAINQQCKELGWIE